MDDQLDSLQNKEEQSSSESQSSSSSSTPTPIQRSEHKASSSLPKSNSGTSFHTVPRRNSTYYNPQPNYYFDNSWTTNSNANATTQSSATSSSNSENSNTSSSSTASSEIMNLNQLAQLKILKTNKKTFDRMSFFNKFDLYLHLRYVHLTFHRKRLVNHGQNYMLILLFLFLPWSSKLNLLHQKLLMYQ